MIALIALAALLSPGDTVTYERRIRYVNAAEDIDFATVDSQEWVVGRREQDVLPVAISRRFVGTEVDGLAIPPPPATLPEKLAWTVADDGGYRAGTFSVDIEAMRLDRIAAALTSSVVPKFVRPSATLKLTRDIDGIAVIYSEPDADFVAEGRATLLPGSRLVKSITLQVGRTLIPGGEMRAAAKYSVRLAQAKIRSMPAFRP